MVDRKWMMNGEEVEWKMLGQVCKFVRGPFGGAIKKGNFISSGYAVYEQQHAIYGHTNIRYYISTEKYKELKRFEVAPGDLIMSCSGTMGKIAIIPKNAPKGVINQALLKLTVNKEISEKYLKYYFENTLTQQMNNEARGGAIKNVSSVDVLKKIQMPIPSLSEQERIVSILDKFDSLVNDISVGLPAEIEARRRQYEFYRNKLLTFKRIDN
jgi:type I restriction enzyme, S subunit